MSIFSPRGLATGIGSLPHTDPEAAISLVMRFFKEIPHWPQLSRLASTEGLADQYLSPLNKAGLLAKRPGKSPYIDTENEDWNNRLAAFYSGYLEMLESDNQSVYDRFAFPIEYAAGFYAFIRHIETHGTGNAQCLKGQITGPVTIGLQLVDQDGRSAYYDDQLRDLIVKNLVMQASWQVKALGRFGLPVIIFIDEPALHVYGQSSYITLTKEDVIEDINAVVQAIKDANAVAGIHSCAYTDWSILLESKADIVSFDAFSYFKSLKLFSSEVKSFLLRGGTFAWGLVPTSEEVLRLKAGDLVDLFKQQMDALVDKGISYDLLRNQILITPSCGAGNLSIVASEKVYGLTAEVSNLLA